MGFRDDLAPTGTLRAGINRRNLTLVQGSTAAGDLRGIAVDLARELARRIGAPVELVTYDGAGRMTDAVKTGAWDVAFLAIDPARGIRHQFHGPVSGNRRHVPRVGRIAALHNTVPAGYQLPATSVSKVVGSNEFQPISSNVRSPDAGIELATDGHVSGGPSCSQAFGRSVFVEEAAILLGVSRRTVYYRIRQGRLRTIRTRCGSQRVLVESIATLRSEEADKRAARRAIGALSLCR